MDKHKKIYEEFLRIASAPHNPALKYWISVVPDLSVQRVCEELECLESDHGIRKRVYICTKSELKQVRFAIAADIRKPPGAVTGLAMTMSDFVQQLGSCDKALPCVAN